MTARSPTKPQLSGNLAIIPAAAVFDLRLIHADIRVLAALCTYADKNGKCWPSTRTLASRTGISDRHVRTCLRNLERLDYIKTKRRPGLSSMYRIPRNWTAGVPRNPTAGVEPNPGTGVPEPRNPTAGDPGTGLPPNGNKNDIKNDIPPISGFEDFWQAYPSRRPHSNPKAPAKKKFEASVGGGVAPADIIRGAKNYALYVEHEDTDPKYICQAQTWLNQERWTDHQEIPADDSDVIH